MRSQWVCGCVLAVASIATGCNRGKPLPSTAAVLAPVPASKSVTSEFVVIPVRHEVVSDGPRVRIHLTMVEIQGSQPFPAELPDLWSTNEVSRVFSTNEIAAAVAEVEKTGIARGRAWPVIEVASGEAGNWNAIGTTIDGVIVTPTVGPDGLIQLSIAPPQDKSDNNPDVRKAAEATLREHETLVVAGPTSTRIAAYVNRIPILGEIPLVGDKLFSSKTFVKQSVKTMYLVRCETVPR